MATNARRTLILSALLASVLALSACDRAPQMSSPGTFKGIDITGADYAKTLAMTDADGKDRTLADFKGKVVVVFFGFTQCPDVCPSTLQELAEVKRRLGPDGAKLQAVFVSLDPDRDTPQLLKAYMANFDSSFVALRGTPEATAATAKHFKVFYAKVPGRTEGSYTIDHTAGAYVFDTKGRVRLFTRHGMGPEAMLQDLKQLMAEG